MLNYQHAQAIQLSMESLALVSLDIIPSITFAVNALLILNGMGPNVLLQTHVHQDTSTTVFLQNVNPQDLHVEIMLIGMEPLAAALMDITWSIIFAKLALQELLLMDHNVLQKQAIVVDQIKSQWMGNVYVQMDST
jgi:hypothetical protein